MSRLVRVFTGFILGSLLIVGILPICRGMLKLRDKCGLDVVLVGVEVIDVTLYSNMYATADISFGVYPVPTDTLVFSNVPCILPSNSRLWLPRFTDEQWDQLAKHHTYTNVNVYIDIYETVSVQTRLKQGEEAKDG